VTTPRPLVKREWGEARFNVCGLLAAEEVATAQGTLVKETKSAGGRDRSLYVSQCFYLNADAQPTVEISVIQKDPNTSGHSAADLWKDMFHEHSTGADSEQEHAEKAQRRERFPPQKIEDLTGEAYWLAAGALYILQGDKILRISMSGPDTADMKLQKAKSLAQIALPRLQTGARPDR
jgi:hypothetical protein